VRVRTYGFPGCFTRPPGTSTRNHPHEPTASKPVVPMDACTASSVAARTDRGYTPMRSDASSQQTSNWHAPSHTRTGRRGPGPLRGTVCRLARGPSGGWWRGLTPQWPRSSRLGSASKIKRTPLLAPRQEDRVVLRARSETRCGRELQAGGRAGPWKVLRHGLSQLRQ
jgi:hypothetical protein